MNSATDRLTPARFEAALIERLDAWPAERTRFVKLLRSGRCPAPVLLRYARSTYLSADLFRGLLARMIDLAPDPEARLILLENLMEEEGIHLRVDQGLVVRPDTRHVALALRFLQACGGGEADPVGDGTHATSEGHRLLDQGRWLEGVAHLLIGQELKYSVTSQVLFEAFLRYGFAPRDIAFFAVHGEADLEHGRQALALVVDRAGTRQEQEACLAAAEAGARAWFDMHGGETETRPARARAA